MCCLPVAAVLPDCKRHPSFSNGFVTSETVNSEDKLCFDTQHPTPNVTTQTQHLCLSHSGLFTCPSSLTLSGYKFSQVAFKSLSSQDQKWLYRQVHLICNMSRTTITECSTTTTIPLLPSPPQLPRAQALIVRKDFKPQQ